MDTTTAQRTIVDARGSPCPGPITDLALAYRRAKVGDVIELRGTDPGMKPDVRAWAEKTGNQIVSIYQQGDTIVAVLRIVKR